MITDGWSRRGLRGARRAAERGRSSLGLVRPVGEVSRMVPYPPWASQWRVYKHCADAPGSPGAADRALDPEGRGMFNGSTAFFFVRARFQALHHRRPPGSPTRALQVVARGEERIHRTLVLLDEARSSCGGRRPRAQQFVRASRVTRSRSQAEAGVDPHRTGVTIRDRRRGQGDRSRSGSGR